MRSGKIQAELSHVGGRCAAKPVDGLPRVSDHPKVSTFTNNGFEKAHRRAVDVLVFVHQHMVVPSAQSTSYLGIGFYQSHRLGNQISEVDQLPGRHQALVSLVDQGNLHALLGILHRLGIRTATLFHGHGQCSVAGGIDHFVLGA
ncbi:hypothetical protein D3C71_1710560 [compost metagenome]